MARFSNAHKSHEHSLTTLELIAQFDDFMQSITSIADMGCGGGLDIAWWATRENQLFEPPRPFNYRCYAIDTDTKQIDIDLPKNVHVLQADFESKPVLSSPVDMIWCHDSFQYALNPLNTLKLWNQQLSPGGVLYICVPAHRYTAPGKLVEESASFEYFHYTLTNLVYMLAVNGFDCSGANLRKDAGDPWIHAMVYKSQHAPMDPRTTSWAHLSEKGLLNESMKSSISKKGFIDRNDLIFGWLDKDWHLDRD